MIMIDVPMPRKCGECPFMDESKWCRFIGEYCDMRASWAGQCRPSDCPLIDPELGKAENKGEENEYRRNYHETRNDFNRRIIARIIHPQIGFYH